jgi:hypothetical protein
LHYSQFTDLTRPLTVPNTIGLNIAPLQTSLNADGWIFAFPAYIADWSVNGAISTAANINGDASNDAGHGSRFQTSLLLWWDHMLAYLASLYGPNRPIIVGGFSFGGFSALTVAIGRPSTIVGYVSHYPVTVWSNTYIITTNFRGSNTTGLDLSTTCLNAVTVPGIVAYSDNDATCGWTNNTADANWQSLSVASVTLGATTTVTAASFPNVLPGMDVKVTGGTGTLSAGTWVVAVSGGNCVLNQAPATTGTATLNFSGPVATTAQFITAAQGASQPVTLYQGTTDTRNPNYNAGSEAYPNGHLWLTTDSTQYCTTPPTTTGWVNTTLDPTYGFTF